MGGDNRGVIAPWVGKGGGVTWSKLDDQLHGHPKVQEAWRQCRPALGLHLLAMSYAGCYLTNGFVPEAFVEEKLSKATERRRAVAALVENDMWDLDPQGGFWIHDYLKYNESREKVLARREADSKRKHG